MSNKKILPKLDFERIEELIKMALSEDVRDGDATSISVIPEHIIKEAKFVTREICICAGLEVARDVFKAVDPSLEWTGLVNDGDLVLKDRCMASIKGKARSILTAERTALNFLQRLCGIATVTSKYVKAVEGTETKILDTRKTTPGWRNLEKYAVAAGGGTNHRFGLYDRIMIKDNHRAIAGLEGVGGIAEAIRKAREAYPFLEVQVEADTLEEFKVILKEKPEYILLDNMTNEEMAEAVKLNKGGTPLLEASGGITLERIPSIAKLGVNFISVGALTHSVRAIDISLEM